MCDPGAGEVYGIRCLCSIPGQPPTWPEREALLEAGLSPLETGRAGSPVQANRRKKKTQEPRNWEPEHGEKGKDLLHESLGGGWHHRDHLLADTFSRKSHQRPLGRASSEQMGLAPLGVERCSRNGPAAHRPRFKYPLATWTSLSEPQFSALSNGAKWGLGK